MNKKSNQQITIYEPNHILKAGIRVWPEMFRELMNSWGLIWRLVVRDITALYKQSVMGILWAFMAPLGMMLIFVWVKNKSILPIGDTTMPYAAFVFLGQMVWLLFSHGVTTSAISLAEAGKLVTKINFPREVLVLSKLGQTVFQFLIRIPFLIVIFLWLGFVPKLTILLVPFALLPLLIMIAGLGFLASFLNSVIRDISRAIAIIMSVGMFATPVIYPPPQSWPLSFWINYANPVSGFVTAARDLTTVGYLTDPASYISATILSILLFFVGWRIFHLVEPKIAEGV